MRGKGHVGENLADFKEYWQEMHGSLHGFPGTGMTFGKAGASAGIVDQDIEMRGGYQVLC